MVRKRSKEVLSGTTNTLQTDTSNPASPKSKDDQNQNQESQAVIAPREGESPDEARMRERAQGLRLDITTQNRFAKAEEECDANTDAMLAVRK